MSFHAPVVAPSNNIKCNTKLPNGQTVGAVVRQQRAVLQQAFNDAAAQAQTGRQSNPLGYELGAITAIALPNGPLDFKNNFTGGASRELLGDAGNFAYYAVGSGFFSGNTLDLGAGAYGLYAVAKGTFPFSFLTGHYFSYDSARRMKTPGLSANGCAE